MRATLFGPIAIALAITACSGKSGGSGGGEPTMTLHTQQELMADPKLFAEVDAQCNQWKGSQKSPLSFPAAVINTCNNLDGARMQKFHERDIQALREAAGIEAPHNGSGPAAKRP